MRRALLCILLMVPLTLAGALQSSARLKVSPSLTLREEYNDNFFLEEQGREEFITTVAPYISALLDTKSINLDLTYGFEFRLHRNRSEFDETDPSTAQRASLEADLFPKRDFTINVLDEFRRVVVDERRPSIEENVVVNRTNLNRFRVSPRYRYRRWKTFTATLSYVYENLSYDDPIENDTGVGNDSDRYGGSLELEKRISKKSSIFSGYNHSTYHSGTAVDYRRDDVYAGFAHRLGPKLTLNAQGGVAVIEWTEDDETTENLLNISVDYSLTEEIRFGLGYDETVDDSVDSGLVKVRSVKATLKHSRRLPTVGTLTMEEARYLDTDREDRSIGAAVQTTMLLSNRVSIQVMPYVTWFEFKPEEDHVLRYGAGLRIQRDFKYGHLSLGYKHHASQNSELSDDYRNNIVFLEVAVRF